jgi:hypothetical protein
MVKKTFRIWLTRELIVEMEVRRGEGSMSDFAEGILRLDRSIPKPVRAGESP